MRRVSLTVPAPGGLGLEMVGVPPGSPLGLGLRLEAVLEGVLVSGSARAPAEGECVRCLDAVTTDLEVDLLELYSYADPNGRPPAPDDDENRRLQGDLLDLEPALRDAVVLGLPLQPLCAADCPGLCPACGVRLADSPGHAHPASDPRWAVLAALPGPPGGTGPDAGPAWRPDPTAAPSTAAHTVPTQAVQER